MSLSTVAAALSRILCTFVSRDFWACECGMDVAEEDDPKPMEVGQKHDQCIILFHIQHAETYDITYSTTPNIYRFLQAAQLTSSIAIPRQIS